LDVPRAAPGSGVPPKPEQADLSQVMGAGQGEYPRIICAPTSVAEAFHIVPHLFNVVDEFQCPGIILSDLLLSEGRFSIDPAELDFNVPITRGEIVGLEKTGSVRSNGHGTNGQAPGGEYRRYEITPSGISPRAFPGTEGYVHV